MRLLSALLILGALHPSRAAADAPTFAKDVAPVLYANCVSCHRAGEVAPFALITHADAKKRAKQIARVTQKRIMPPWKPVKGHGEFQDDRSLSESQIKTIAAWAEAGAPLGDEKDMPAAPKFKDGWQLGKPDMILKMPKAFTIPAEGRDIYMHFVFPLELKGDRHLKGIEARPSNRRVAHHAVGLLDGSGTARKLSEKAGGNGYPGWGGPGFLPVGFTPGYVPGQTPRFFEADSAITLKKGQDFVLQMHYHPTGKEETDQTEIGLYFTDKKPKYSPNILLLGSEEIDIPADKSDYTVKDVFELPADLEVRSVWGHMHMIGKKMHVVAELPDGKSRELLKISDWDFNWQDTYLYKKPFVLPKGTKVRAEFVFDNSADNPRNPNTPPKRVTLGEGSKDEMAGLIIGGTAPGGWPADLAILGANIGHYFEMKAKGEKFQQASQKK